MENSGEYPTIEQMAKRLWRNMFDQASGFVQISLIRQAMYYGWHVEAKQAIDDLDDDTERVWNMLSKQAASEELGLRDFERIHDS